MPKVPESTMREASAGFFLSAWTTSEHTRSAARGRMRSTDFMGDSSSIMFPQVKPAYDFLGDQGGRKGCGFDAHPCAHVTLAPRFIQLAKLVLVGQERTRSGLRSTAFQQNFRG